MPTYRACLVDVFDTVVSIDMPRYNASLADRAGIDPEAFAAAFRPWSVPAMEGRVSLREAMAEVLRACGSSDDDSVLDRLVTADRELVDELAVLHADVVPFLESLREHGVRTAFVSNCAENTRPLLDRLGLTALVDELVFLLRGQVGQAGPGDLRRGDRPARCPARRVPVRRRPTRPSAAPPRATGHPLRPDRPVRRPGWRVHTHRADRVLLRWPQ